MIAIPTLLSHIPLVDRLSSSFSSTFALPSPAISGPITLVDIPTYAHPLCPDSPSPATLYTMFFHLCNPCLAVPVGSHLDINSPLWALYCVNLQNQCLGNLLALTTTEESIARRLSLICSIQRQIDENLTLTMFQLGMPEFLEDIDRYLRELQAIPIHTDTSYPPPSPLSPDAKRALCRTELMYEISTRGTLDGEFTNAPLRADHPHYRETCYQCHCLGHLRANCPYYKCPHYLQFSPGHSQRSCHHHPPSPSSSTSSVNPPVICHSTHFQHMIPTNAHPPRGNWHTCIQNSCSSSPNQFTLVDSDYDDKAWGPDGNTNITGSPSYRDF